MRVSYVAGAIALVLSAQGAPAKIPVAADYPTYDRAAYSFIVAGLTAKDAARRLASGADDFDQFTLLVSQRRFEEALAPLERIAAGRPDLVERAFAGVVSSFRTFDRIRDYTDRLRVLVAQAHKAIATLPRERAAAAARVLLNADLDLNAVRSQERVPRLRAFMDEYAGTTAALLTEVDLLNAVPISMARLDSMAAFAKAHPNTTAGAKALYQQAFDLGRNASALRIERAGDDPTARFLRVVEISRALESGAWPASEWVERAPELIVQFFSSRATYSEPAHIETILAEYRDLLRRQLPKLTEPLMESSLGFVINTKMGDLYELRGDRIGGIEGLLADLEREAAKPIEIREARAAMYLRYLIEPTPDRPAVVRKVTMALRAVAGENVQPQSRRALAQLASVLFYERDYAAARPVYEEYLKRYPESDWTWLAHVRLGQSALAMEDVRAAAGAYERGATASSTPPVARVLALAFLADAAGELGRVADARAAAERALAGWDDDFGDSYRTQAAQALRANANPYELANDTVVTKAGLRQRVAELQVAATMRGGALLEQGRRMIARNHAAEAVPVLRRAMTDGRGTEVERAARFTLHRATLLDALSRVNTDRAGTIAVLEALSAEPPDFPVIVARVAHATILSFQPVGAVDADRLMTSALQAWQKAQPRTPAPLADTMESDVALIRREVFRPLGGGVYGTQKWNAFEWPSALPLFMIANPEIVVKLANSESRRVLLRLPIPGYDSMIFLDADELDLLSTTIRRLGGDQVRARTDLPVMATPNQPIGTATAIRAFWNRYFPMRQGHWSGWVFETYPQITDITFLDAARTKAAARVTIGYAGGTVMLVKEKGVWRATELTGMWVT